ncbi:Uncharacterised protein [Staphylococcus piscifermentans]|uniref:Uncharacterized protein n=1 Tax=Staphylococcus piscifermentans TaxID=70258 RepID=A0A239UH43_9STAP|nr:hypothetical protein [Staphylococcus piscifermentans]RTX84661.1 hypothetical protein CD139_06010 [Staphylococcus piscifermentans]GEP85583.1 hypothetical protein SPI02_21680 [Staphylococcus piscifermentans]SNV08708.1 Uncharacterised protein [Staphylococcus piscifermentans]
MNKTLKIVQYTLVVLTLISFLIRLINSNEQVKFWTNITIFVLIICLFIITLIIGKIKGKEHR